MKCRTRERNGIENDDCRRGTMTAIRWRGSCDLSFTSSRLVSLYRVLRFYAYCIQHTVQFMAVYAKYNIVSSSHRLSSAYTLGVHSVNSPTPVGSSYYGGRRLIKTVSRRTLSPRQYLRLPHHAPLPRSSYYFRLMLYELPFIVYYNIIVTHVVTTPVRHLLGRTLNIVLYAVPM